MGSEETKKNCVILYSRRHFNPGHVTDLDESSAARIAREVYESAIDVANYNVFYFDSFDQSEWIRMNVDILISLVDNRNLAIWFFKPKKSYVIAVNMHPMIRLQLIHEARKAKLPVNALTASDGIFQSYRKLKSASEIVCVGNEYIADSFREYLPSVRITSTYYNSTFIETNHNSNEELRAGKKRLLVLASSIGFRKGADLLIQLALTCQDDPILFEVVGYPELEFWKTKLFETATQNKHFIMHGWVNNKSEAFRNLLENVDAAVFLSREEGLLGSLLECVTQGIPSFHGIQTGLTPCQDQFDITHLNVERTREQILEFLNLPQENRLSLTHNQKNAMLRQFRDQESIRVIVNRWLNSTESTSVNRRRLQVAKLLFCQVGVFIKSYGYWRIYFLRLKVLTLRYQLDKLAIRSPSFYAWLKKMKDSILR